VISHQNPNPSSPDRRKEKKRKIKSKETWVQTLQV